MQIVDCTVAVYSILNIVHHTVQYTKAPYSMYQLVKVVWRCYEYWGEYKHMTVLHSLR